MKELTNKEIVDFLNQAREYEIWAYNGDGECIGQISIARIDDEGSIAVDID